MRIVLAFFALCGIAFTMNMQPPKADKALMNPVQAVLTEKGKNFKVNKETSTVNWVGTKPSGKHTGTIKISEGNLQVAKNTIRSGSFTIDMGSITDTDLTGKGKDGLEGHLKSGDFFDVAKYPTAKFELTGINAVAATQNLLLQGATHNLSGNLTLKGVTQNVTFPAIVNVSKKSVTATADFNIDRTLWGVNYGSDGKVAKEINIKLDIKAEK